MRIYTDQYYKTNYTIDSLQLLIYASPIYSHNSQ